MNRSQQLEASLALVKVAMFQNNWADMAADFTPGLGAVNQGVKAYNSFSNGSWLGGLGHTALAGLNLLPGGSMLGGATLGMGGKLLGWAGKGVGAGLGKALPFLGKAPGMAAGRFGSLGEGFASLGNRALSAGNRVAGMGEKLDAGLESTLHATRPFKSMTGTAPFRMAKDSPHMMTGAQIGGNLLTNHADEAHEETHQLRLNNARSMADGMNMLPSMGRSVNPVWNNPRSSIFQSDFSLGSPQ